MDYIHYFEPLELDREAGRIDEALLKSQQALLEAGKLQDPVLAINAYAHQLLIFKDQFTHTGEAFYLHLMHSLAVAGFALARELGVDGQPVAVMHLRNGDYFFHYKKYPEAVAELQQAVELMEAVKADKPGEYAEYLSHLGKAKVYAGMHDGIDALRAAVELTAGKTELREFHHTIVHSGNMLRLLAAYHQLGDKDQAIDLLRQVYPLALELKEKHNMPLRFEQVQKIAEAWDVRLDV